MNLLSGDARSEGAVVGVKAQWQQEKDGTGSREWKLVTPDGKLLGSIREYRGKAATWFTVQDERGQQLRGGLPRQVSFLADAKFYVRDHAHLSRSSVQDDTDKE